MTIITDLILEASDGTTYTTERYRLAPDAIEMAARLERPPFSNSWFVIGDGKRLPAPLAFSIKIRETDVRSAIDDLQDLRNVLASIETLRWGEYHRPILTTLASVASPTGVKGFNVEIRLAPSGPSWLDEFDQEVSL